ncbi:COG3650 family protein [Brevundimonas sp. Root1279]|uniref:COG3650 family protein n=1 Tax=Brevundimonas sp. Root1279 TaxID=1736443 RepID=UPI0006F81743|nr:hypothetical protein [Brevundimonas sp. Root1279]KQW86389.1 hypothetical protein ASC65_00305 [Brevundimonas sp. Root1279]
MRLLPLSAVALCLLAAACGPSAEEPEAAPEPAAPPPVLAGVDLTEPVRALGTEPFWSVDLTGEEVVFRGVDRPEQRAPQPKASVQGTVVRLESQTTAGTPIVITLASTECSDGMSERIYPLTAIVKVGEETLNGCAASTAAIMTAGEQGPVTASAEAPPAT